MLFASYEFIFVFLPIFFALYFLLLGSERNLNIGLILVSSAMFYSVSSSTHLLLLGLSICVNYGLSMLLLDPVLNAFRRLVLVCGLTFNLSLIGYFKYIDFFIDNIEWALGTPLPHVEVLLPLGISFFTFQQIAYLVDAYNGRAPRYKLLEYATFVSYFPQLIAGPIVHHRKFIPQLRRERFLTFDVKNVVIGLSIFIIGLFKKVVIADGFASVVDDVFTVADTGAFISFLDAWFAAISYAFQIYFDFSGYADMALGMAIVIGLWLPINFNSPYKACSIIDFWKRWHITLSSFLKNYLYIPLGGNRLGRRKKYRNLAIVMLLGGLWHGASWNFVIWGGLHGCYLIVNHAWRYVFKNKNATHGRFRLAGRVMSWVVTMAAVVVAWVFFRAETMEGALSMCRSMLALDQELKIILPASIVAFLNSSGIGFDEDMFTTGFLFANVYIADAHYMYARAAIVLFIFVVVFFPNTPQLFSRHSDTTGVPGELLQDRAFFWWAPNLFWGLYIGVLFVASILMLSEATEFIYFKF